MRTLTKLGLTTALALAAAACGGDREPARDPSSAQTTSTQTQTTGMAPSHGPQEMTHSTETQKPALNPRDANEPSVHETARSDRPILPTTEEKPATTTLTDAQIVAAAVAANEGEVQMAELAKKSAQNAEVKQFAVMMQSHHTKGLDKTKSLESKAKISADDNNDVSTKLKTEVSSTMQTLKDKKGAEFDKAYMESQVKAHKDVLDAIDNKMLPGAQNGELKAHLNEMRRQVADHLAKAESIQKRLDPTTAKGSTGKTDTMGTTPSIKK